MTQLSGASTFAAREPCITITKNHPSLGHTFVELLRQLGEEHLTEILVLQCRLQQLSDRLREFETVPSERKDMLANRPLPEVFSSGSDARPQRDSTGTINSAYHVWSSEIKEMSASGMPPEVMAEISEARSFKSTGTHTSEKLSQSNEVASFAVVTPRLRTASDATVETRTASDRTASDFTVGTGGHAGSIGSSTRKRTSVSVCGSDMTLESKKKTSVGDSINEDIVLDELDLHFNGKGRGFPSDVGIFAVKDSWITSHPSRMQNASTKIDMHCSSSGGAGDTLRSPYVLHPICTQRLVWDTCCMACIFYDCLYIPMQVFSLPESQAVDVFNWMTRVFWTFDIPASFFVGFFRSGKCVMNLDGVVRHYLMTWFLIDLFNVAMDWVSLIFLVYEDSGDMSGLRGALRVARVSRVLRLVRMLKLRRLLQMIYDHIGSEINSIYFGLLLRISAVLILTHFVACSWYGIGKFGSKHGDSWTARDGIERGSFGYRYCTSLHWSMAQFAMGSMDIHPANTGERLFAVIVIMSALILFTALVGSITTAMENIRNLTTKETQMMWVLRRFLKFKNISQDLSTQIFRHVEYSYLNRRIRVQEADVVLLGMLPESLLGELQCEIHSSSLCMHPLFQALVERKSPAMRKVCTAALSIEEYARTDNLAFPGVTAKKMMILVEGMLIYATEDGSVNGSMDLEVGATFGEGALWTKWKTLGLLRASIESRVLTIESSTFCRAAKSHQPTWEILVRYAQRFVEELNTLSEHELSDVCFQAADPLGVVRRIVEEMCKPEKGSQSTIWSFTISTAPQLVSPSSGITPSSRSSSSRTDDGRAHRPCMCCLRHCKKLKPEAQIRT